MKRSDMGFRYEAIKSLLSKFDEIEKCKDSLKRLRIRVADIGPSDYNELGGALLWRLALHYIDLPGVVKEIEYSNKIKPLLDTRHFLDRLTGNASQTGALNVPIHFESFAPFKSMDDVNSDTSAEAVYQLAIKKILNKENEFHKEVSVSIYEILNNVFDHSASSTQAGIVCSKSKSGFLTVCAVDMGQGIKQSFLSNPLLRNEYLGMLEEDVISKATRFNVSCNPSIARHPDYKNGNAGIGLYYLKALAERHHGGQLILLSGKGYFYTDSSGRKLTRNLKNVSWPGTVVYFRVNLEQGIDPAYKDLLQSA